MLPLTSYLVTLLTALLAAPSFAVVHTLGGMEKQMEKQMIQLEPDLLKGINLRSTVVGLGRLWRYSPLDLSPKAVAALYTHSKKVEDLDFFLSHTWQTAGWKKVLTLTGRFGLGSGVMMLCFICLILFILHAIVDLPDVNTVTDTAQGIDFTMSFGCFFFALGIPSFHLGLVLWPYLPKALGGKEQNCFLDVVCIDQVDETRKLKGIYGLGDFLTKSKNLMILWSPPQFFRKWCVYEIAAYFSRNPMGKVHFYPLFVEQMCLIAHIVCTGSMSIAYGARKADDDNGGNSDNGGMGFALMFVVVSFIPMTLGTHFVRISMREKHKLRECLENFDVHKAECREESDKKYVHEAVKEWFGSEDAFNEYVRGKFRAEVLEKMPMGGRAFPYRYLVMIGIGFAVQSCDYTLGYIKSGVPASIWLAHLMANMGAFFFAQPWGFGVVIWMAERFAAYRGSRCADYALSMLLGAAGTFLGIFNLGLASVVWKVSIVATLLYCVIFGSLLLCMYKCGKSKKEEDEPPSKVVQQPSTKVSDQVMGA